MTLLLGLFVLLLAATSAYAAWIALHIVRQKRAEITLAEHLADDSEFRELLAQYAEQIYQFGEPTRANIMDLWLYVLRSAEGIKPHGYLIVEALTQPSTVGRHRYLDKLVQQALRGMLHIPVAELELESNPDSGKREELASV